jgi:hypothetical protein
MHLQSIAETELQLEICAKIGLPAGEGGTHNIPEE